MYTIKTISNGRIHYLNLYV